jgi:endonuclease/exonuclease/phosphatase family metal-dependent hydrolase
MPLSVLTLNIWHNSGPWPARRALIRDWIAQLHPDLIGFQEVLRGPGCDQLAELLDGLGYHTDFEPAVPFWDDQSLAFGNAVAARWPLRAREAIPLPDAGDDEKRVALAVTVDAPFGPVGFACTHLNWKLHHGWVREQQVVAVCALSRRLRPRDGFPPIIVGDFNAQPESAEVRYVKGLQSLDGRSVYYRDAWAFAGDGRNGTTWSNQNEYARTALEPNRRIDYIFAGPPLANGVGQIESCRVICDDERDGVWPSDHFGVYADLRTTPYEGRNVTA